VKKNFVLTTAGLLCTLTHTTKFGGLMLVFLLVALCSTNTYSQENPSSDIRLNQVGFYPHAPKTVVVYTDKVTDFHLATPDQKKILFKGKLAAGIKSFYCDKIYKAADFTAFTVSGKYVLVVPGLGSSYPFEIKPDVNREVSKAAIKNYYFQRMSIPLEERYAGKWQRHEGHPDNNVLVHPSAASASRPEGTIISSPRGWYDAGDYNKYIVNSGITMGTMFSAYEDFEAYYKTLTLNIPESKNDVPDLLDELLWNLRWMLTMQDPEDGGVYHKLTNPRFDKFVMPDKAVEQRFVVQKGTSAALNFAAVTAQAARIFKTYEKQFPGLSDSCLSASRKAWEWAEKNPTVVYNQTDLNKKFDPDISTGAYGDRRFTDEFFWAGVELYLTTKQDLFLNKDELFRQDTLKLPSWNQVKLLGFYSLLRYQKSIPASTATAAKEKIVKFADQMIAGTETHAFKTVMGKVVTDYIWGSTSVAANQGVNLIYAYQITGKKDYLNYAIANMDFLLGRNGTGYSFVTGFGSKQVMHPHHRPSEADGVVEPIPGMLSGGPNPGMQDKCNYSSGVPEEAFTDDVCSYASNEIAINWNAPLVYLSGALEALQVKEGK
jgi:endoglucanase